MVDSRDRIIGIVRAGLLGHKSQMLRLMKKYVDGNGSDYWSMEFMKLLSVSDDFRFLVSNFNKRYSGFAEIDFYHQTLFIDGEVQPNFYYPKFDNIHLFIDACEREIARRKK